MTIPPGPQQLYALLVDADHNDDRAALTFVNSQGTAVSWSRNGLFAEAERLGKALRHAWVDIDGDSNGLLAILVSSQEQQVLLELAALSHGIVPAILTPHNRKLERTAFLRSMATLLEQIAPTAIVTDLFDELKEIFNVAGTHQRPAILSGSCDVISKGEGARRVLHRDPAFVQFSSGTTGIKKAVAISSSAIVWQLAAYRDALSLNSDDVIVNWLPLYHDMGFITSLHLALFSGVHSVLLDPLDWIQRPVSYVEAVDKFSGTLSWHPNFAFAFMARRIKDTELSQVDLSSIRALVNCSEPVTFAAQQAFADKFRNYGLKSNVFVGCYAMAETTFAVTHGTNSQEQGLDKCGPQDFPDTRRPAVSVGKPLTGLEISIKNQSGNELTDRQVGEIWIKGPCLADGYSDSAATSTAFIGGWYRTGDLGYRVNGEYYICGRHKDLLILAGHNVFPEDVERITNDVEGVKQGRVAAFSQFDERLQSERIVVLAEAEKDPAEIDFRPALQRFSAELGVDGALIHIVEPGWLIKSSSGKISRAASATKWRQQAKR